MKEGFAHKEAGFKFISVYEVGNEEYFLNGGDIPLERDGWI